MTSDHRTDSARPAADSRATKHLVQPQSNGHQHNHRRGTTAIQ
jgi:uncharacterized alpha/beta hydrolase family protein